MSQQAFSLIVCIPGQAPVRHDLGEGLVSFGRSPENGIQILVSEVSVKHGTLIGGGGVYRLSDVGSTNGTRLNGVPVGAEGVELRAMDKILLGSMVPAYFVSSAILESTPIQKLIASIEAASKAAAPPARKKTAPVPVRPEAPSVGGTTVRLDQIRTPGSATPPTRPAPSSGPLRQPVAVGPSRPPGVPVAGGPPVSAQPPSAPGAPPAGGPGTPQPVPLKRPLPGAATIPLPKLPPRSGGQ